ncbi:MAG: hypothetical protein HN764_08785, partial [Gammaproteobacteria bacterium]|nr:hypothetical protein [Gammaproteobacteria bacterium]
LFVSEEQFLDDVSQLVSNVRNSKPRPGVKQVALPGDSGEKFFAECRQYGIPIVEALVIDKTGVGIERKIYDQLVELAAS